MVSDPTDVNQTYVKITVVLFKLRGRYYVLEFLTRENYKVLKSEITYMMESRSRASPEQFAALIEFMERNGDISRPQQGPQGRIKADRLWQELVELLNSLGGGVSKPMDKWKKAWADWKAKTKKKALDIRREASRTGGGPSSRLALTALEERVLGIMGLTSVIGLAGIKERGFDAPQSERISPPPVTSDQNVGPSISSTYFIQTEHIEGHFTQDTTSTAPPAQSPLPSVVTPPPGPSSAPMPTRTAASPIATTSRGTRQRRRNPASASPAASSPTLSTPRRRGLLRARTRRIQTPFERATSEFVAVEIRRLRLEENRDKMQNEREVERLRLESRRLDLQERQDQTLNQLVRAVDSLVQTLPQLRLSSLPSTDIIP